MIGRHDSEFVELVENRTHPVRAHPVPRGQSDRHSVLICEADVDFMIVGAKMQRSHVRIEMGHVDAGGEGFFDLGAQLGVDLVELVVLEDVRDGWR